MSSRSQLGTVAVAIAASLSLAAVPAADAADEAEKPVPVDEFQKGLMTALGGSFEYLGGEVGWTEARIEGIVGAGRPRFWFAKVRPKVAGEFAVLYTIKLEFADHGKKSKRPPERGYIPLIKIGERGAPRVVLPPAYYASAYPHANVGDTLLIPVRVDRFRTGHTFAAVDTNDRFMRLFFSGAAEHQASLKRDAAKAVVPVVRNDAADRLDLLGSWGRSDRNRPWTRYDHSLFAILEFKEPGELNLGGRLADADEKAVGEGTAFRVLPKDKPVTVVLGHLDYEKHTAKYTDRRSGSVSSGTLEVRVGDRVLIGCCRYSTSGDWYSTPEGKAGVYRPGVVVLLPFRPVEPYTPEPRK